MLKTSKRVVVIRPSTCLKRKPEKQGLGSAEKAYAESTAGFSPAAVISRMIKNASVFGLPCFVMELLAERIRCHLFVWLQAQTRPSHVRRAESSYETLKSIARLRQSPIRRHRGLDVGRYGLKFREADFPILGLCSP